MVNVKIQITTQQMIQVVGAARRGSATGRAGGARGRGKARGPLLRRSALSPRECQRIFKAYLHRTPMEYLQWRRILAAADDLRNTNEFCPCRFWEQMV